MKILIKQFCVGLILMCAGLGCSTARPVLENSVARKPAADLTYQEKFEDKDAIVAILQVPHAYFSEMLPWKSEHFQYATEDRTVHVGSKHISRMEKEVSQYLMSNGHIANLSVGYQIKKIELSYDELNTRGVIWVRITMELGTSSKTALIRLTTK